MDLGIEGKAALITGGSHGIGKAIALALAEEGCRVAVCARDADRVHVTVSEIEARSTEALGVCVDVMEQDSARRVMDAVTSRWGTIHILVNNVGGGGRWGSSVVEDTPEDVWMNVYRKNALAAVQYTTLALPYMRKQRWGRVVTIASIYGREGGGRPWFTMAKSAEISLMKSLALQPDLSGEGITFNTVSPGRIMIPETGWEAEQQRDPLGFEKMVREKLPQGRMGTPEEVAAVVAFICSRKAVLLNGANIAVDGGEGRAF